jgi:hypothetical protein
VTTTHAANRQALVNTQAAAVLLNQANRIASSLGRALAGVEGRVKDARESLKQGVAPGRTISYVDVLGQEGNEVAAHSSSLAALQEMALAVLMIETDGDREAADALWIQAVTTDQFHYYAAVRKPTVEIKSIEDLNALPAGTCITPSIGTEAHSPSALRLEKAIDGSWVDMHFNGVVTSHIDLSLNYTAAKEN